MKIYDPTVLVSGHTTIGISDDRLLHSRAVGRRAAELASLLGWSIKRQHQMFVLGFVHDIGYEYATDQRQHETVGGELLRSMGVQDWRAVAEHGDPDVDAMSDELFVINLADMQTDSRGNRVSMRLRLDSIAERYGKYSQQYLRASALASRLTRECKRHHLSIDVY